MTSPTVESRRHDSAGLLRNARLLVEACGIRPGFDVTSFVTTGAGVVMGGVGNMAAKTRYANLSKCTAARVARQWLFVLTLRLPLPQHGVLAAPFVPS